MEPSEHKDALHTEAGATVNYRIMPAPPSGACAPPAAIPHLLGRFRVLGEIARGGMGVIVRAYDPVLDRELAIKLLAPEIPADSEASRRLAQEARVASQLHHPGIIPVFEAGTLPDGRAYFAMPFIDGQALSTLLEERPNTDSDLPRWLRVFARVCDTVAHAHREGIVHRDLKPSNVMVGRFGDVMLMDWGVAAMIDQQDQVVQVKPGYWVFGTPAYMPPEQAGGKPEKPDCRSDVFGLGAVLCEILTGQPPYPGPDVASVTRLAAAGQQTELIRRLETCGAETALIALAVRCMSPDCTARPASASEVSATIKDLLSRMETRPATLRTVEPSERRDRRYAGLITAILAVGVSIAVGAFARELRARGTDSRVSPKSTPVLTPIEKSASQPPARP